MSTLHRLNYDRSDFPDPCGKGLQTAWSSIVEHPDVLFIIFWNSRSLANCALGFLGLAVEKGRVRMPMVSTLETHQEVPVAHGTHHPDRCVDSLGSSVLEENSITPCQLTKQLCGWPQRTLSRSWMIFSGT